MSLFRTPFPIVQLFRIDGIKTQPQREPLAAAVVLRPLSIFDDVPIWCQKANIGPILHKLAVDDRVGGTIDESCVFDRESTALKEEHLSISGGTSVSSDIICKP
jgi:hypothetical protein